MYYRRKLLLGLLEALDRPVPKVEFQKYLFLVCITQDKPSYEFVSHKFGCYSFQVDADKRTLAKYSLILDQDFWQLKKGKKFGYLLSNEDKKRVCEIVDKYAHLRGNDLIREVYLSHPYYAINSTILDKVLTQDECMIVEKSRPTPIKAKLFTIGYEGKTLEKYLQKLSVNQIGLLCDVRRNPVSMKFGFSKNQLSSAANAMGIEYLHIPELGIESHKRKNLDTEDDYKNLFDDYRSSILKEKAYLLDTIVELISRYKRIALTCFEADHKQCHRGCVSEAISILNSSSQKEVHL